MPSLLTSSSPHIHGANSVPRLMYTVLAALLPALAAYCWFFGPGILIHLGLAYGTALACEALMLRLRGKPLGLFLSDGSCLVSASLLCFAIPSLAPWWLTVIGISFAIVVAKHLYGGLGHNPFNPAMIGYALLLISFPREMTSWLSPTAHSALNLNFSDTVSLIFGTGISAVDAVTMASPLDHVRTELGREHVLSAIVNNRELFGLLGGAGWEWINAMALLGGVFLLWRKIIHWHIPVATLVALLLIAGFFHLLDPARYSDPLLHLFSGATMLGAFFIATDPVSAATTNRGRLYYGAGIGIIIYVIRTWGGYPDGVAFAVLLMNMAAPTLDYFTQPRVFGHGKKD